MVAIVVLLAGCEDFQVTEHLVMEGSAPARWINVPARDLTRTEVTTGERTRGTVEPHREVDDRGVTGHRHSQQARAGL